MDSLLKDLKINLDIKNNDSDELLINCISSSIKSIRRYINNSNYNDEIIISDYDDIVLELAKRGYENTKVKRGVKQMSQGQRSITYSDTLDLSPYTITSDLKSLLPGPFIKTM